MNLDNAPLWDAYARSRSDADRNRLVEAYLGFANAIGTKLWHRGGRRGDVDDFISWAVMGLMEAIATYKPGMGVPFRSYAQRRVAGYVIDELRRQEWVPRLAMERARRACAMADEQYKATGERMAADELRAMQAAESSGRATVHMGRTTPVMMLSASTPVGSGGKELADFLPSRDGYSARASEAIEVIGRPLSRQDRAILRLYYEDGLTMQEIGRMIGLSESRVSQVHSALIERLKNRPGLLELLLTHAA